MGGVLYDTSDPIAAAEALFELISSGNPDPVGARAAGLEPALVESLRRRMPAERRSLELACAAGAGWVLGRRSAERGEQWEVVASLPRGTALPDGVRRTTGETMIGLVSQAKRALRFTAPYIDNPGIGFLTDAVVAATLRGVIVELYEPRPWPPGKGATSALGEAVRGTGRPDHFHLVATAADAPFAHLKVMVADGLTAYIGSANITAAALAGHNVELGVLVRGTQVAAIEKVLDLYREPTP